MKRGRKFICILMIIVAIVCMGLSVYANGGTLLSDSEIDQISTKADDSVAKYKNNECLWMAEAILTNTSGRNFLLEGTADAYHKVDFLKMTLYLEYRNPKSGILNTEKTFSATEKNEDYFYKAFSSTVTRAGDYRIYGFVSTTHLGHGTETFTITTNWISVD